METDVELDPWERQDDEPGAAWKAFQIYRDMGPTRSVTKMLERRRDEALDAGRRAPTMNPATFRRMSSEWSWVSRAIAWDREVDRVWRAEQLEGARRAARQDVQIGNAMLAKVADRLNELTPHDLRYPNQVAKWVEVATKIRRLALGDPTEIVDTGEGVNTADGDTVRRILDDPVASEHAIALLERLHSVDAHGESGAPGAGGDEEPPA